MTKELWINLPVKDVARSREFYKQIGFKLNPNHPENDQMAAFLVGEKEIGLMLFTEEQFKEFSNHEIPDPRNGTSTLFSFDAESPEEVDEIARKAKEAGGTIYGEPGEKDGWMYGAGFIDPDGHRWSILYMDMSKMPKG
ncbi:MAG: VOC family protein [Gracilimonas sp.]|uniref:VOC family protein n=1 Tax=Gracilimonas sp. TaxID=1974203 RepID=UPI0019A15CD0|nr:VOC family protein [Gracilimonas sp.]MBD3616193.1 VOC family protein [Gracilimonas sp.]